MNSESVEFEPVFRVCHNVLRTMFRSAYTLLEVLIATAILALGLAAVFTISQASHKKSVGASELAEAQLVAQSTLNELLASEKPIQPSAFRDMNRPRYWKLAVDIYSVPQSGLQAILLTTQKFTPQGDLPIGAPYRLIRWVPADRIQRPQNSGQFGELDEFEDPFR